MLNFISQFEEKKLPLDQQKKINTKIDLLVSKLISFKNFNRKLEIEREILGKIYISNKLYFFNKDLYNIIKNKIFCEFDRLELTSLLNDSDAPLVRKNLTLDNLKTLNEFFNKSVLEYNLTIKKLLIYKIKNNEIIINRNFLENNESFFRKITACEDINRLLLKVNPDTL